jgi:hypothetical protein
MNVKKVNAIFCLFILLTLFSSALSQTPKKSNYEKIKQVGEAGDKFVERFRETLDFGIVFDEMSSRKSQELLKKGRFNFGKLDRKFYEKQNCSAKLKIFKAELNFIYVQFAFMATFLDERDKKKPDFYLPPGYHKLVKNFKFVDGFSEFSSSRDRPRIQNDKDLQIYLKELKTWTRFLKNHLPKNYYTRRLYKINLDNTVLIPKVTVSKGDSQLEIPEGTFVFQVIRDMFCIDFIEEDGQMKILGFVIGN